MRSSFKVPFNDRSLPVSHWGGIVKLILPLLKLILEMGRALPPEPTKSPTSVCNPECLTSSQDGTSFPFISIVRSQRPSRIEDIAVANARYLASVLRFIAKK